MLGVNFTECFSPVGVCELVSTIVSVTCGGVVIGKGVVWPFNSTKGSPFGGSCERKIGPVKCGEGSSLGGSCETTIASVLLMLVLSVSFVFVTFLT